jgi:hypothetical protein
MPPFPFHIDEQEHQYENLCLNQCLMINHNISMARGHFTWRYNKDTASPLRMIIRKYSDRFVDGQESIEVRDYRLQSRAGLSGLIEIRF